MGGKSVERVHDTWLVEERLARFIEEKETRWLELIYLDSDVAEEFIEIEKKDWWNGWKINVVAIRINHRWGKQSKETKRSRT